MWLIDNTAHSVIWGSKKRVCISFKKQLAPTVRAHHHRPETFDGSSFTFNQQWRRNSEVSLCQPLTNKYDTRCWALINQPTCLLYHFWQREFITLISDDALMWHSERIYHSASQHVDQSLLRLRGSAVTQCCCFTTNERRAWTSLCGNHITLAESCKSHTQYLTQTCKIRQREYSCTELQTICHF